jgi:hypothetical protein
MGFGGNHPSFGGKNVGVGGIIQKFSGIQTQLGGIHLMHTPHHPKPKPQTSSHPSKYSNPPSIPKYIDSFPDETLFFIINKSLGS